jgi:hypothetical protein
MQGMLENTLMNIKNRSSIASPTALPAGKATVVLDFAYWFVTSGNYGPQKPLFDKTWVLPDVEKITVQ